MQKQTSDTVFLGKTVSPLMTEEIHLLLTEQRQITTT